MTLFAVSEVFAGWVYAISSIAVIVFGILAYWSSGKLSGFTDLKIPLQNNRLPKPMKAWRKPHSKSNIASRKILLWNKKISKCSCR